MSDSRAAPDRLPWLTDDLSNARTRQSQPLLLWALFATLLLACVSYWLGMTSVTEQEVSVQDVSPPHVATVKLPQPAPEASSVTRSQPVVEKAPSWPVQPPAMPQVQPVTPPSPVRVDVPRSEVPSVARKAAAAPARKVTRAAQRPSASRQPRPRSQATARPATALKAWPAFQSAGADGRLVRIGTFGSRAQAKRGWRQIVRAYPGMARLKAAVVPNPSLRNGRVYYRLQFGTTSHAHSTVLCQRMRMIAQSCVTVGTPTRSGTEQ